MTTATRHDEIRLIWTQNQWLYIVAGFLGGLLFFPALQSLTTDLLGLLTSLVPEAIGILVTVLCIDRRNRRRDAQNAFKQLQEQLVRDAGSLVNDVANNAVHQLGKREWLRGSSGLLVGADLRRTNLQQAVLWGANLQRAKLTDANLHSAWLDGVKFEGAELIRAELGHARLRVANLQGSTLLEASLQGADLRYANLRGANLTKVNMEDALIDETTKFDETTILPDRTHWTPDTDMTKFTRPTVTAPRGTELAYSS